VSQPCPLESSGSAPGCCWRRRSCHRRLAERAWQEGRRAPPSPAPSLAEVLRNVKALDGDEEEQQEREEEEETSPLGGLLAGEEEAVCGEQFWFHCFLAMQALILAVVKLGMACLCKAGLSRVP